VYTALVDFPRAAVDTLQTSTRTFGAALVFAIVLSAQGCGSMAVLDSSNWEREHPLYCRSDEQTLMRDTLYFGRSIPGGGSVDDAAWKHFEDDTIAPAFVHGFSVIDAHGTWRGNDGATVSEPTRIVVIVHDDDAASETSIRGVVRAYRDAFQQQSVLRERVAVCASF
jgi:Protein of unknown function (DUF3574)